MQLSDKSNSVSLTETHNHNHLTFFLDFEKNTFHNGLNEENESAATAEDTEYALTIRKRVIQFIQKWVIAVRQAVFEEPLTVAFIEVNDFFLLFFIFFFFAPFTFSFEYVLSYVVALCYTVQYSLPYTVYSIIVYNRISDYLNQWKHNFRLFIFLSF